MKKLTSALLATVIAAGAAVAAETSSKTGFYLGGNVGVANTNVKYGYMNNASKAVRQQNFSAEGGKMNPLFGLFAGYGMQMGNTFYLGAEVYAGFDSAKVTPYDDSKSASSVGYWKSQVKRTNFLGFAPRVGFMVNPHTLVYAKLGAEMGKWKAEVNPNAATIDGYTSAAGTNPTSAQKTESKKTTSKSKNSISFAPGIGVDAFITKNLFLRAEYSYLFGPSLDLNQDTNGYNNDIMDGTNVKHTYKISQHAFKLGLGYKF